MDATIVDREWFDREVATIVADLQARFPELAPAAVRETTVEVAERLVVDARVARYLPVLIQRDARARLSPRLGGES